MAGTQRLLAIVMAFFLTGTSGKAPPDAVGIVAQADNATLGSQPATAGTTIYNGDRVSTGADGSLRLLVGGAIVYLMDQSSVIVRNDVSKEAKEFEAELVSGAVVLSVTARTFAEIVASSAHVRSAAEARGVVQVRIVGPRELIVFARRGPAEISYRGESETVAEGKFYRVLLNPPEDGASGGQATKKSGKRNKALVLIAIGAAAAAGVTLLVRSMDRRASASRGVESPDHP
jgi:hypothetical protein